LRILAQLRKLEQKLKIIVMDSIEKYIDEKRDVAFLVGLDKGEATARERELTKFVTNLLQKLNLTFEQIADVAGTTVDFVKSIQQQLSTN
jgi:RNase H-fold protein (predicted Holliday junction resolvase)